jgi:hypothetical protein
MAPATCWEGLHWSQHARATAQQTTEMGQEITEERHRIDDVLPAADDERSVSTRRMTNQEEHSDD